MKERWRIVLRALVGAALILLLVVCGLSGFVVAQVYARPNEPVVLQLGAMGVSAIKRPVLPGPAGGSGGSVIWFGRVGNCGTTGSPLILGDMQINMLRCRR